MTVRARRSLSSVPAPARPARFVSRTQEDGSFSFPTEVSCRVAIDILNTWSLGEQCRRELQEGGARELLGRCEGNIVEKGQESSDVMQIDDTFRDYQTEKTPRKSQFTTSLHFYGVWHSNCSLGAHAGVPIGSMSVR